MKPSELSESVERAFAWWKDVQITSDAEIDIDAKRDAVIEYLRNSIPKPVVEVHVVGDPSVWGYSVFVNEHEYGNNLTTSEAQELSNRLRTALGINDTEGGE